MAQPTRTAIVIGASLAGLLAASALARHVDEVIVLDRDRLPDEPLARVGVPHSRQVHGLLARGREAMEELLPGLTEELCARGAELGDFQERTEFYVGDRPLAHGTSGLLALAVSRPLLEHQIRSRVMALPGVTIRDRVSVLDLVFDSDPDEGSHFNSGSNSGSRVAPRVVGVTVSDLDGGAPRTLTADLVVDASGRSARTPEWLERHGWPAPSEDRVRIDVSYVTRQFRRTSPSGDDHIAVVQPASPDLPRSSVLIAQEGDRWIVGITGYLGERPPLDLAGFIAYADSQPGPIGRILSSLEPLDEGATYRFAANIRRRYERLATFPAGLLVLGDALCAFDPAYGQGMSVAALEALELRACLDERVDDLAREFFRRSARHVDTPWTLVVGRDRELPGSPDPAPWGTRQLNRYVRALLNAATHDPALATIFLRVSNLNAPPSTLMAPGVVAKVVRQALHDLLRSPARHDSGGHTAQVSTRHTDRMFG